jgi:hypothetical protein
MVENICVKKNQIFVNVVAQWSSHLLEGIGRGTGFESKQFLGF